MHFFPIYGGQETYIDNLNKIFEKNKIDVSVIQPTSLRNKNKPHFVHYVPSIRLPEPLIKGIPFLIGQDWFWFNSMLWFKKKFLKKQNVLISHYPFHYSAIAWHKNVIVVSHGLDWSEPPNLNLDKHKKYSAMLAKHKNTKIVSNDTCFLRALDFNIKEGTQFFEEIKKNVWFIPNCIDTNKFYFKNEKRKNVILVPRNIRKSRGIHLAIEAFNLFSQKHNEFILKIVGGPLHGKYYKDCMNLVHHYSLENKVQFTGNIPNKDLVDIYNKSKITIIPTIAFEGTCLSALESMACKTPVVSTRVGGLSDLPTYKVDTTPKEIFNGLEKVLNNWNGESKKQYIITTKTFNLTNWEKAWLEVIKK